ncbi:putative bifunctional diguanylate cyclase/phosphodiesterase [Pengzhenrongella frigida]|nr:bifunctional diguanylate cyclase/phosphodiesterase [Cellulomonas sp. HLT2-17]
MVHQEGLSSVLSDFARTMLTSFPIQAILEHLVERIVDVLPVSGAGVTLIATGLGPRYVAASSGDALAFERLQTELGEGPCLTAFERGTAIAVPDLAADDRYPRFGPAARAANLAAVFTFPLRHDDGRLGALDLYRDVPGSLDLESEVAAQTLADVAAAYLLNAQAREEALQAAEWLRDKSLHDALTGLANRTLLQERLEHASQRSQRWHRPAAVLFVDLDRFRAVEDAYGDSTGDQLLKSVAERLSALLRPGDTLARVSADEFVFLCEDLSHTSDADVLVSRIIEAFAAPFTVPGGQLALTASVGIAYDGPAEAMADALVLDASMSMYQTKRLPGAANQVIDLRVTDPAHVRNQLERDLQLALSQGELDVAYQPIVRAADAVVTGAEALLRWTSPSRGAVPALTTVAVAEQCGLITEIGAWVLERACRERGRWLAEYTDQPLDLSVNVSPRQLMGPGFVAMVAKVLAETAMEPAALVLEVTESVFIDEGDRARRVLGELKALGVRLALDDFGTGYCSLNYLQQFPVDIVKIDQSFVANLGRDAPASAIVTAVTHLTHVLGMTVTAEGVETAEQREEVVGIGCEHAQGFLFARPLTAREFAAQII